MGKTKSKRQKKFTRTEYLAKPRYITRKYVAPKYYSRCKKIDRNKGNASPRLEQLAMPNVRKLLATKENHNLVLKEKNFDYLNDLIEISNQSMYSKLAKVQMPEDPKKEKWTKERWEKHRKWQETRAIHKKIHSECFTERCLNMPITRTYSGKIEVEENEYLIYLAAPKSPRIKFAPIKKPRCYVKKSALFYEATEAIGLLATPIKLPEPQIEEYSFENPYELPRYLQKTKSIGTKNLALPKKLKLLQKELDRENDEIVAKLNSVSPFALKYKPTENMKKLAEARKNESRQPDRTDFSVSPAAIKGPPKNKAEYYQKLAEPKKINK